MSKLLIFAIRRASKTDLADVEREGVNKAVLGRFGISLLLGLKGRRQVGFSLEAVPTVRAALDAYESPFTVERVSSEELVEEQYLNHQHLNHFLQGNYQQLYQYPL